jgi:hypothetical protein
MGWCVVSGLLVICMLCNIGMGAQTVASMLDGIGHHLASLRPIYLRVFMFNTLGWSFLVSVL